MRVKNKKYPKGCSWDGSTLRYNKKRGSGNGAVPICIKNLLPDAKQARNIINNFRAEVAQSSSEGDEACPPAQPWLCVNAKLSKAAWKTAFDIPRRNLIVALEKRAETEGYTEFVTSAPFSRVVKAKVVMSSQV